MVIFVAVATMWNRSIMAVAAEQAAQLGVPVDDISDDDAMKFALERFSSELFRNRLADFIGILNSIWGWVWVIVEIAVFLGVAYNAITNDLSNAVFVWFIVGIWFISAVGSLLILVICKLLTGRYPNEPKLARKFVFQVQEEKRQLKEAQVRAEQKMNDIGYCDDE